MFWGLGFWAVGFQVPLLQNYDQLKSLEPYALG